MPPSVALGVLGRMQFKLFPLVSRRIGHLVTLTGSWRRRERLTSGDGHFGIRGHVPVLT